MNLDKLNNCSVQKAGEAMYNLLDSLEKLEPHYQVLAPALLLLIVAEHLHIDLGKVFEICSKMEHDERYGNAELFRAMRAYVRGELMK